jgi:two-component system sensor histidine kinase RpfC
MDSIVKMPNWYSRLNKRLQKTGDSEPEQAKIRIVVGLLLMLYFFVPWTSNHDDVDIFDSMANVIIFVATCSAFLIFVTILSNPKPSPNRRVVGIFSDIIPLSSILYLTNGDHLFLVVFYLWVSLGNGFRYGVAYLYISCYVSLAGFYSVVYWGEFWQTNQSIANSLIVILFVIPIYASILLKKLHKAIVSAKFANEAKTNFLSHMSHELRTPLNGVIGMGELLRETNLSYEQRELVDTLHSSANTLLDQIENVLDIAKIEAGKVVIQRKELDLHALVNSVIHMLSSMGTSKDLSVSCVIDPYTPFCLNGDHQHIRQVLINLLSNAIKFTDEGSVLLNVYKSGGTYSSPVIRFEVIDTGIGITPEFLDKIFDDFSQAEKKTNRTIGGTGLGTTISKELVELMDGQIGVKSELNKGSVFWIELPMEAIPHSNSVISNNRLLLLASEDTATILRPPLKTWDIDFTWVSSSSRALSLLTQSGKEGGSYDIAIIDQDVMSDISAVQFAQILKSDKLLQNTSLVLVNSSDSMINMINISEYYISTILCPEDKRALFNAIHAAQSVYTTDDKVVTLADYYQRLSGSKGLNILVAEDNVVNQQVIQGILKSSGHTIELVDNGEKALDALSSHFNQFDMVILDMNMPLKSGIEVVKALRFMDRNHSMPVIMLTADATTEAKELGLDAGANAFLTKPVDAKVLLQKIAALSSASNNKSQITSLSQRVDPSKSRRLATTKIVDESKMNDLFSLGNDHEFIESLIINFNKDGSRHVERIKKALSDDYPEYREALHALKGSASELGAIHLVDICLKAESMKPYDIGTNNIKLIANEIKAIFIKTMEALTESVDSYRKLPQGDSNAHPDNK